MTFSRTRGSIGTIEGIAVKFTHASAHNIMSTQGGSHPYSEGLV